MTYDDFLPYVHPSVTACPVDTVLHMTRLAAIEFCRRAHVWREDLDTLLADGFSTQYALALDDQVEVAKLLNVDVQDDLDTKPYPVRVLEGIEGRKALRDGWTEPVAWTDSRRTLFLQPALRLDARIKVFVALKPSLTSFSFPDHVFAHHAEDIAQGAIARILRMPKVDWRDTELAADYEGRFKERIGTGSAQASRGFARRPRRPSERFL